MRYIAIAACVLGGVLLLVPAWGCGSGGTTTPGMMTPPPPPPPPMPLTLKTFQDADLVIGQPDFVSGMPNQGLATAANNMTAPGGMAEGSLYIVDQRNNRILGFNAIPTMPNASADFVLGQPDFTSAASGTTATTMSFPVDAAVLGTKLVVSDAGNSRILIWNALPTANAAPADVVVGQTDLTTSGSGLSASKFAGPGGISVTGGRLIVSDAVNHRVLIWNALPTMNGTNADLVLGQADFLSGMANRGLANPAANTLDSPSGVWTDGTRLVVADRGNNRVLIWNTFPFANGKAADLVLGQPGFTSNLVGLDATGFQGPSSPCSNGVELFVADAGFNRVMIWNAFPTVIQQPADAVLGQDDFMHGTPNDADQDNADDGTPSPNTLSTDTGPARLQLIGTRLFVADLANHRVLVFDAN